jgi:hypothetical protein
MDVAADLDDMSAHVGQIRGACETCAEYQRLYELEPLDLGALALVEKELNHKAEVGWCCWCLVLGCVGGGGVAAIVAHCGPLCRA